MALTLGSLFLYTPESALYVDRQLISATIVAFGAVVAAILFLFVRDRARRPTTGKEGLIGEVGQAVTAIDSEGKVRVHGEYWKRQRCPTPLQKTAMCGWSRLTAFACGCVRSRSKSTCYLSTLSPCWRPPSSVASRSCVSTSVRLCWRLGRLVGHRGPGIIYVIPGLEKMLRIDMRTITMDVPTQDVITRDNRLGKGQRGSVFPCCGSEQGRRGGGKLPLCDFATGPDDAA